MKFLKIRVLELVKCVQPRESPFAAPSRSFDRLIPVPMCRAAVYTPPAVDAAARDAAFNGLRRGGEPALLPAGIYALGTLLICYI